MSNNKKNQKNKTPEINSEGNRHIALGLLLILISMIIVAGMTGGAGAAGRLFNKISYSFLGVGEIILPIVFGTFGIFLITKKTFSISLKQLLSSGVGLLSLITITSLSNKEYGGFVGRNLAEIFILAFDKVFAAIVLIILIVGSFSLFFDHTPRVFPFLSKIWEKILSFFKKENIDEDYIDDENEGETIVLPASTFATDKDIPKEKNDSEIKVNDASSGGDFVIDTKRPKNSLGMYIPPPLNILEGDRGKANVGDVKANANIIRRTLLNFGIEVEMDEVTIGPTVTRYALKPAEGVKLSRIVGLQNDLALALAAHPIRIEAPIPGKSLVGIEIPNKSKATVGLVNLLSDQNFAQSKPLTVALGRNIAGKSVLRSIAKMPHLLIAGTTGSGKSVTIHTIITSLLYRHGPDDLRFIFVDPKRVELTLYNGIPHLLTPVITDSKKAILALKWAATEMNRRYDVLEAESVRDIESYHKKFDAKNLKSKDSDDEKMPFIVIIIDELADIMQAYPRELEAAIVRLAQMSRAVGIHLILSTQRPEVSVITGLIKANVPARIALRVPTQIDSRTILDTPGAEKLLGQGDMLAVIGDSQAERLQSAYITEDEVKNVVKYLKGVFKDDIRETIELSGNITSDKTMWSDDVSSNGDDDDLYEEARQIVIEAGKASTSYIQRKLKVGYARAARLMDMMEERGVISGSDGAKAREVLVDNLKNSTSDSVAEEMGL